jgi:uncharacterized protein (DUF4213/DUF364 family)
MSGYPEVRLRKKQMWEIYDELINAVPEDLKVAGCLIGIHWTLVRSRAIGMALTPFEGGRGRGAHGGSVIGGIGSQITGMPVRKLAEYVKSWDPFEATLGLAAINSFYNSPDQVEQLSGRPLLQQPQESAFAHYMDRVRDKKVAVVGRFPDLVDMSRVCRLTVLERNPGEQDLPDPACEYILPEQDFVFITATALINKTLPRLLELSRNACVFLVGPSTPFAPVLFRRGIRVLAGTVVMNRESVWQAVQEGAARSVFNYGAQMVKVSREEWEKQV